jgi:glucosamine 6-phosphate synthetase-like amidotransferase/phosphosugar isomerase protein
MCGIAGYVGYAREGQWGQTHSILRELFLASEHRGRDATGFAALTEPLDRPSRQSPVLSKEAVPASHFVGTNDEWLRLARRRCSAVIQHVRAATHGAAGSPRNAHPFRSGSGLYLVHNGVVSNDLELLDSFSLRRESDTDSEVLLGVVAQAKTPAEGLATCLREVRGSMAVAVLDSRTSVVYLANNGGRPLWVCRLRNERRTFFASTAGILLTALERVLGRGRDWIGCMYPIAPGYVYALRPDGRFVALTADRIQYLDFDG